MVQFMIIYGVWFFLWYLLWGLRDVIVLCWSCFYEDLYVFYVGILSDCFSFVQWFVIFLNFFIGLWYGKGKYYFYWGEVRVKIQV